VRTRRSIARPLLASVRHTPDAMHAGFWAALAAYALWGIFPIYFRQLSAVPAFEIVLYRSLWSLVFVIGVLAWQRRWQPLRGALRSPRQIGVFAASALLLSGNWVTFVWAVNNHHVIEASLGYFINPLFSVLLGVLVLRERPRALQWAAIGVAAAGVLWLGWVAGRPPWIALVLAVTFGLYGLLRKTAPLGALDGLALETLLLAPFALGLAIWVNAESHTLAHASPSLWAWLALSGPFTAIPLLLFARGARTLPLATLGLLQYVAPTLQFALGVWLFGEPLSSDRLAGFALIWLALGIYSAETLWRRRRPAVVIGT